MTSQLQSAGRKPEAHPWVIDLLETKANKLIAWAMANKADLWTSPLCNRIVAKDPPIDPVCR